MSHTRTEPCGCGITRSPGMQRVRFCHLHLSAPEMVDALVLARRELRSLAATIVDTDRDLANGAATALMKIHATLARIGEMDK